MISLVNGVFGALMLYSTITNPVVGRGLTEMGKMTIAPEPEIKVEQLSPSILEIAKTVPADMKKRILDRVPDNYPLFLDAAENALIKENDDAVDISPDELAWLLIGQWMKENNLCLGLPDRRCPVSSTGARGPMQFMPGTWSSWGRDGNDDGKISRESLADSAYAAAEFLYYLRQVTGSWNHAVCNYYGDNTETCSYQRGVRRNVDVIKSVLASGASADQLADSSK
jgi:hypothetical protein